ncbi:MAG: hypothetical protein EPO23_12265 [Xanthobacteraceae bacterium]|nr:MAG: hypothetical protein EPO23_12265 [Xanthobacteraceae bacterium]
MPQTRKPGTGQRNVGYKNPQRHTQFKKGQSGNPKGRPKGAKSLKTAIQKELHSKIVVEQNGVKKAIFRNEAIAKGLVNDAIRGRDRPRETVLRYADEIDELNDRSSTDSLNEHEESILDDWFERELAKRQREP